ncbi:MAG: hypothetical protein DBX55_01310 [Verrucomicrobia bacterium]|nr:MAG: hypothetical protein DBX55_01310 [Verrucomicrobiota bacterium]
MPHSRLREGADYCERSAVGNSGVWGRAGAAFSPACACCGAQPEFRRDFCGAQTVLFDFTAIAEPENN